MAKDREAGSRPETPGRTAAALLLLSFAFASGSAQGQDPMGEAGPVGAAASLGGGAEAKPSGFFGIAYASIFGASDQEPWRPLKLRTFFSEGWDEPWIAQPDTSGDAQQGWIDAADGSFYRLYFFSYNFTRSLSRGGNGHTGDYTLYTPLSRRLELITTIPFVTSQPTLNLGKQIIANPGTSSPMPGHPSSVGFGDLTFTPRFLLIEEDLSSLVAQLSIQTPTGYRPTGAGQTIVSPGIQYWSNFAEGWVLRGGFSANVGTNRVALGTSLLSQLALGRVVTPYDTPWLGDLTFYLSTNVLNPLEKGQTTVTLTPGFRDHLGKNWFVLGGIEVPVTGPRPYQEGVTAWLMKVF